MDTELILFYFIGKSVARNFIHFIGLETTGGWETYCLASPFKNINSHLLEVHKCNDGRNGS